MAQQWSYNGFDLNTYAWNVRLLGAPVSVPARRGDNVVVGGRTGRLHVPKLLDQRTVTLAMFVRDIHPTSGSEVGSEAQMRANLDQLRQIFAVDGQRELRHTWGAVTRVAQAEVVNTIEFEPRGPNNLYTFVVEFLLADPLWYAESATVVGPIVIVQSPQNIAVNNGGTYKAEKPKLTVTGPITNPKFTIGLVWVQYTGAVASGQTLVIDAATWTATLGSTNVTGDISHDGAIRWLEVPVGVSTLIVESSGFGSGTTVKLEFTEAFI